MTAAEPAGIHADGSWLPIHRDATDERVEYEAELWCEFERIAYVFIGDSQSEITHRIQAAKRGAPTWDSVRPLTRDELYGGLFSAR